jgi:hypothetical protein
MNHEVHASRAPTVVVHATRVPRGWPTSPTLQPLMGLLHGHALQEAVTMNPKLEVGGSWTWLPTGHVARTASVDISYAAPQVHGIVNVALHQEYSLGIVIIFSQGRKDHYHV